MSALPKDAAIKRIPDDYSPAGSPRWYALVSGQDRGKQLYYTDQVFGHGGELQTLVFVHGNPECSYIFRKVIQALLDRELPQTRIITADHIGFGLSSRASRRLTPADHAGNLSQLLAFLALRKVTMVIHDWGGPIGLGAMLDQPELLDRLAIFNSGIFPLSRGCNYRNYPFSLLSWSRTSALIPNRYWGAFAAGAITSQAGSKRSLLLNLLRSSMGRNRIAVESPYAAQFSAQSNIANSKYLSRLAGHWCESQKTNSAELNAFYERLQAEVKTCWGEGRSAVEARLLCGEWDALGKRENADAWLKALPQLEGNMTLFPGCGHFLPETHPQDSADAIYDLLTQPSDSG